VAAPLGGVRASIDAGGIQSLDLDALKIPDPPVEEPEEEKKRGGLFGFIDSVVDTVGDVANVAVGVVKAGANAVGDAAEEIKESLEEGQGIISAVTDGVQAGAKTIVQKGLDPLLDRSVLGKDDQGNDQGVGLLGPLLTNRLSVGESVDLTIEAGATLPTQLVGAPNIKLDQSGTLRIKRVPALDAQDNPILDPVTGEAQTRIEVELIASGRAGAAYSAEVGFSATTEVGAFEAGVSASATAEAEAGLTGSVSIKLHLDPNNPDQMASMTALLKSTVSDSAISKIPGLGQVLSKMSTTERDAALAASSTYIESIAGEGGLYLAASARAELEAGLTPVENEPSGTSLKSKAKDLATNNIKERIADELSINVAGAGASAGANLDVGYEKNFRNGTRTVSISAGAGYSVNASVLEAGGKIGASTNRQMDFVFAENGELTDINIQQTFTKAEFLALQNTLEDLYGRPFDPGFIMKAEKSDSVTVNFSVRPEVLARIKTQVGSGSPQAIAQAARTLFRAAISKDDFLVKQGAVTATERNEFSVKVDIGAAFGAEIGIRGGVTIGHEQESKA
jgi:hypothetical protein